MAAHSVGAAPVGSRSFVKLCALPQHLYCEYTPTRSHKKRGKFYTPRMRSQYTHSDDDADLGHDNRSVLSVGIAMAEAGPRTASKTFGTASELVCQRCLCPSCGKVHRLRPLPSCRASHVVCALLAPGWASVRNLCRMMRRLVQTNRSSGGS